MRRKVSMAIGDWSEDGHGKSVDVDAIVTADDASNEKLAANLKKFENDTGIEVEELFREYEDSIISLEDFMSIIEAGVDLVANNRHNGPSFTIEPPMFGWNSLTSESFESEGITQEVAGKYQLGTDSYFSAADLLLSIFGYGDDSYSYEIENSEKDYIVGYNGGVLNSFGYGLFFF